MDGAMAPFGWLDRRCFFNHKKTPLPFGNGVSFINPWAD